MSIIGVGIDVAEIDRFRASLERTPGLAQRLFVEQELHLPSGERRGIASLAVRFAAKEAVAKALGAPAGMHWTDAEVYVEDSSRSRGCGCGAPWRRARPNWASCRGMCRSATTRAWLRRW